MLASFLWILYSTLFFRGAAAAGANSSDTFPGGLHGVLPGAEQEARRQAEAKKNEVLVSFLTDSNAYNKLKLAETFYEPYWSEGHWVYYRPTTTTVDPSKLTRPTTITTKNTRKTRWPTRTMSTPIPTSRHCNVICLKIYQKLGKVCGRRLKLAGKYWHWEYYYKTFSNMCALENYNCHDPKNTFVMIHAGTCTQTHKSEDSVPAMPASPMPVIEQANRILMKAYGYTVKPYYDFFRLGF